MKKISRSLCLLLLTALPAMAEFEGTMDMKMTISGPDGDSMGGGNMKVAVGKPGFKSDLNMQMPQMNMKMVMLMKNDTPDIMYRINDANKTYVEMKIPKAPESSDAEAEKYVIKKLGKEKIAGYTTEHILAIHNTTTNELWIAKDFLDYETFKKLQARGGRTGQEGLEKALKDAGVEGMPMKTIMSGPMGGKMTMEVVKVDKQSLPASTFEIPSGYTKSEGGIMDAIGGASSPQLDDAKKKMQEQMQNALKNMTPEQREKFEQMMKQRGVQVPQ